MFNPQPKKKHKKKKAKQIPINVVKDVLIRENYTCQRCNRQYQPEQHALHCHHIIKKSQGGNDVPENLEVICWLCHVLEHR